MQKYKEINGNDYVKNSRTTINETMQSIQSMNSGTAFPTTNLFEGMKCYRTDLKKTYTLTDVENNTWVEDAHATLSDEATHAASATKLQTARSLNLGGAVTADAATFDGTANATINVKTLDATKLKGTASVSTTGNAATATKVVATAADGASANIAEARMASNYLARIRVSGTTNAGELALETADDGSEPIVARQYTGIYTTPVRTAKILDESGNTSFPGTVVAPKFTGTLNGNAATATKLQTPRTLSLTGKAAGSTSFDGSSNASINVTSVNADTASKLSTARKINITGNASGSASFDGSSDININTTVNESKHAAAATTVNATAPNGGAADLAFGTMAANDYARIRVYGKDDNGALEIATADGGNEPIYARQYSGAYDWPNGRPGTVTNEAAILDSNGNTKFPKNVTAASFTGPLKGNADTASKLNTVGGGTTTFNWVGKAGQPNWLWGGNNSAPTEQYVYNPSNFHVASANTATSATTAGNVSNKIYYSADSPSVATDKLFTVKQAHKGDDNVSNNGLVIQTGPTGAAYNGKLYITDNGSDGVWIGGVAAGKEVGWTRLVENKGSWNINSATATKLQTPRTISLTGNASGSANFDGSGNVSINTTVNRAAYAVNAENDSSGASILSTYLKRSGGTMAGALNFANATWNLVGDDSYMGDHNIGGTFCIKGANDNSGIALINVNNEADYARISYGGGNINFNKTIGGNLAGNAASATNADKVDGYHASDIINRISAANTGGIVAASLTENGYVKFANGLILQWGYCNGDADTTFPISFKSFVRVVCTCDNGNWAWARDITTTGFSLRAGGGACWLAVGM